jgi:flagellar hook assembly protein FlgD
MYAFYFGSAGRSLASDDNQALQCAQNRYPISEAQFASRPAEASTAEGRAVALTSRPRTGGALLRFALAEGGEIRLQLYDVAGRQLTTLVEGYRPAGEHEVAWDGSTASGRMPSGVYFARITTASEQARATVILAE